MSFKLCIAQFDIRIDILRVLTNIISTRRIKFMIFTREDILLDFVSSISKVDDDIKIIDCISFHYCCCLKLN